MLDQATRLREMAAAFRAQATGTGLRRTRAVAVTSGKGGVGKTNLSINLAHALVSAGKSVILMDVDLGLANADILLGAVPLYHLGHLLRGERELKELIYTTAGSVKLIAGGSGLEELANITKAQLKFFVDQLSTLDGEADYLILDTGAGLNDVVMQFLLAADQVLVVTTPEPTSLADGYAVMKALAHRHREVDLQLIVNQVDRPEDGAQAVERIKMTARNFLSIEVEHLGSVPRDPYVWQAVRDKRPFLLSNPGAPASRAVKAMAQRLILGKAEVSASHAAPGFFQRLAGLFGKRAI